MSGFLCRRPQDLACPLWEEQVIGLLLSWWSGYESGFWSWKALGCALDGPG